jgi:NAD+ kinase
MKVGIYGQTNNETTIKYTERLIEILQDREIDFLLEKNFSEGFSDSDGNRYPSFDGYEELDKSYEVFFTVGGDGTFLRSVTLIRDLEIPVIGINTGRLGFLATVPKENIGTAVEQICNREFKIGKRSLLSVRSSDKNQDFGGLNFALNEVSVSRKNTASMIKVDTYLDQEFLTTYWSDGLIVSTATGSTGYSMSCGGPIISPSSKSLVLTPIAPHSLAVRPLVVPQQTKIGLNIDSRVDEVLLTLDSRMYTIGNNSRVFIERSKFSIHTINLKNETFIKTLREKLLWGEDKRN